jgi:hypothetical protein
MASRCRAQCGRADRVVLATLSWQRSQLVSRRVGETKRLDTCRLKDELTTDGVFAEWCPWQSRMPSPRAGIWLEGSLTAQGCFKGKAGLFQGKRWKAGQVERFGNEAPGSQPSKRTPQTRLTEYRLQPAGPRVAGARGLSCFPGWTVAGENWTCFGVRRGHSNLGEAILLPGDWLMQRCSHLAAGE